MTLPQPAINWNFARAPRFLDPRAAFTRASVARGINRIGNIEAVPANAGRWRYNPISGECEGLLIESQRTNLELYSDDLSNAAHTKTDITVGTDGVTGPDGATNSNDKITATAADANVAQAVTITSGRGVAYSRFFKASASSFVRMQLSDGSNTVECWFNLASGAKASNTTGAASLVYSDALIIPHKNGWYRCILMVLTSAVTTVTQSFGPAASDGAAAANGDAIYARMGQVEAPATSSNATSYIFTTSATVTRSADYLSIPADSRWISGNAGAMFVDYIAGPLAPHGTGNDSTYLCEAANTSAARIVLYRGTTTANTVVGAFLLGGVFVSTLTVSSISWAPGARIKAAIAWSANDTVLVVNGGAPSASSGSYTPFTPSNIALGNIAYAVSATTGAFGSIGAFQTYPFRPTNADLQALTAA